MGGLLEIIDDALYHSIDLMPESCTCEDANRAVTKAISDERERVSAASEEAMFASGEGYDGKKLTGGAGCGPRYRKSCCRSD
ncbi:hypothetical protein [Halovulum sp. GXIMD14793]